MNLAIDFLLVSGFVINLIILFSLFQSARKELPRRILFLFFLLLLFVLIESYGDLHQLKPIYLLGALLTYPGGYLAGPLLLLYVKSLYLKEENLVWKHRFHFILFPVYFIFFSIPISISILQDDYLFTYLKIFEEGNFHEIEAIFQGIFVLLYAFLTLRLLDKYQSSLKLNFSNFMDKDLNWIRHLILSVLAIMAIDTSSSIYDLGAETINSESSYFTVILLVGLLIYLGYYGTSQSKILLPDFILDNLPEVKENSTPKLTQLSGSTSEEIAYLKRQLFHVLKKEKPYLGEDLTLKGLADLVPTTDKKLSALLNHHLNTTFYDLINAYRVEAVKTKLTQENFNNYTLLAIANECGFKSKTSFNRIFKKIAGLTPTQYKRQIQNIDTTFRKVEN